MEIQMDTNTAETNWLRGYVRSPSVQKATIENPRVYYTYSRRPL